MKTRAFLPRLLFVMAVAAAVALSGCNKDATTSMADGPPQLHIGVFDYSSHLEKDIAGQASAPTSTSPYRYLPPPLDLSSETNGFNSNIGIRATDPHGLRSLAVVYQFFTCAENGKPQLLSLTSFNNGIPSPSDVTLTASPPQQNGGEATTELFYPITITSTDLTNVTCLDGRKSSGNGTIELRVTTRNFSNDLNKQTATGLFDIRVGAPSPIPERR